MKKYYSLFLFWSLLTGLSTSCSDDNKKDPYLPTPPQVSIGNPSGQTTCLPGETIELKAILNNPLCHRAASRMQRVSGAMRRASFRGIYICFMGTRAFWKISL